MAHPTGESKDGGLKLDFDRRLTLQFRGSVVTSDAGLLAYRELDDALGLSAMAGGALADARTGKNGRHALVGLLRQSVFARLAGYEDVNDARTPAPRSGDALDRRSQVGFRRPGIAQPDGALPDPVAHGKTEPCCARRSFRAVDRPCTWPSPAQGGIVLDMNSSVSPIRASKRGVSGTAITPAPAIIRCSCSTSTS